MNKRTLIYLNMTFVLKYDLLSYKHYYNTHMYYFINGVNKNFYVTRSSRPNITLRIINNSYRFITQLQRRIILRNTKIPKMTLTFPQQIFLVSSFAGPK